MKKLLLASIISGLASVAAADSFQDFNNNLYAAYQYGSLNGGAGQDASQYGIGGTFQSKNNVWLNANAVSGVTYPADNSASGQTTNISNLGFAAGYAFQFFGDEQQGFQVIPHVDFTTISSGGAVAGTAYIYGLGVKPEYRLLNSLKVAVNLGVNGQQVGGSSANGTTTETTQVFGYYVSPGVQYDINKTVMLGLDYTYAGQFNTTSQYNNNGTSLLMAKVGYLF
jgi:hypothetical protein